jgi:hypothetical protein
VGVGQKIKKHTHNAPTQQTLGADTNLTTSKRMRWCFDPSASIQKRDQFVLREKAPQEVKKKKKKLTKQPNQLRDGNMASAATQD